MKFQALNEGTLIHGPRAASGPQYLLCGSHNNAILHDEICLSGVRKHVLLMPAYLAVPFTMSSYSAK
jgi:hypothetical protein